MAQLFEPYSIKGCTLKNRIVMSPMCMYSCMAEDGKVTDWHKTHYTARAAGQVGLIIIEATAVSPEGRISLQDMGLWSDDHISGLRELTRLIQENGAKSAIQLAHAGRKATVPGRIIAPSSIPFSEAYRTPEAMSLEQIETTIRAFGEAAKRAKAAGFDVIEIHAAHGYLINEFLSPLTNHRDDEYGGDHKGRYYFIERIIDTIQEVWDGPLFVRLSANEYDPNGNTMDDMVYYAERMKSQGVDLIDCSSGAVVPATFPVYPGYQVPLAEEIRNRTKVATGAVGLITSGLQAEEIIRNGRADLIFLGRELLRDPYWPRSAAQQLGIKLSTAPKQYERAW